MERRSLAGNPFALSSPLCQFSTRHDKYFPERQTKVMLTFREWSISIKRPELSIFNTPAFVFDFRKKLKRSKPAEATRSTGRIGRKKPEHIVAISAE